MYFKHEWRESEWFKKLNKQEIQLLFYLNNFADQKGITDVSINLLKSLGKLSHVFILKWTKSLEEKNIITVERTAGRNNFYTLKFYTEPVNDVNRYQSTTFTPQRRLPVNDVYQTSKREGVEPVNDVYPNISLIRRKNKETATAAAAEWNTVPAAENDFEKISNFINRLKGKIPDTVIDFRLSFFKELFKYKTIKLSEVQSDSLTKLLKLKSDYKSIIEKNYSIDIDLLIDMCIEKKKQNSLEPKPSLKIYRNELEQAYLKQGEALCTGVYDNKKVTDTVFYKAFIRTNDISTLRKLYELGKKHLIEQNRNELITAKYEWQN